VAAVTVLSQAETELSLQQHLDLAPSLLSYSDAITGEEDELLMMAQPVPHQSPTDKKRVKVYELRNNDWFDRGTGFCTAAFVPVSILILRLREHSETLLIRELLPDTVAYIPRLPLPMVLTSCLLLL
jgi:hypothetical protein